MSMVMRAAVCTRYGPPDVVRVAEVEKPAPGDGEVLVRVYATTVNRTDCGVRSGKPAFARLFYGLARPKAAILGNEFAGQVEAVGHGVTSFQAGDRVFGFTAGFGARGEFGAHAEYLVMPAAGSLTTMPANLTYEQAAPGTEGGHYALALIRTANIGEGHDVLVYGATGAIGSAAVQLVRAAGARVTAVCATSGVELVRGLGADRVVDYTAQDFTKDDQRYDFVIDAVGKTTFGRCRRLLKPGGSFLVTDGGTLFQNLFLVFLTPLLGGKKVRFGLQRQTGDTMRYFKELIESGQYRPVVDRRYSLDEIVDAYRYVDTGRKIGNVVIGVPPS
jgi:NADPH:quinone reductase-like Zn-dependent oxidoreductase